MLDGGGARGRKIGADERLRGAATRDGEDRWDQNAPKYPEKIHLKECSSAGKTPRRTSSAYRASASRINVPSSA